MAAVTRTVDPSSSSSSSLSSIRPDSGAFAAAAKVVHVFGRFVFEEAGQRHLASRPGSQETAVPEAVHLEAAVVAWFSR